MAEIAFLYVKGNIQGEITGIAGKQESVGNQCTDDHLNESRVIEVCHTIESPKDPSSGQATGSPIHGPLCLTKVLDSASPQLSVALATQEDLDLVIVSFMRTNGSDLECYANWVLGGGKVVGITSRLPDAMDPNKNQYGQMEDVHISYKEITWNHIAAGTGGAWKFGDAKFAGSKEKVPAG